MADGIFLEGQLEVRDSSGATIGFLLPERQLRELLAERDSLQKREADLRAEIDAFRAQTARELASAEAERDQYLELLEQMTEQEVTEIQSRPVPFEQVIADVEAIIRAGPSVA